MRENPTVCPLWNGRPPNQQNIVLKGEERVDGDILEVRYVTQPTIEARLPAKGNATGQAVLVIPGGGYGMVAYDWEGTDIAGWLNSRGIAAFVLKYRLPNSERCVTPHLTPLLDAARAMRLCRSKAEEWGFDPQRLGVMGFSAGGHIASTLSTAETVWAGNPDADDEVETYDCRPDFQMLIYPVISMEEGVTHGGSRENLLGKSPSASLVQRYSNEAQVTHRTPPTFLLHSTDDVSVPYENSLALHRSLVRAGVEVEMHLYPFGGHGYSLALGRGRLEKWVSLCADWLVGR